jgi:hypothetical protein
MKRSTVVVLVLMGIGVVLYASIWVWVQAMGR